MSAKFKDYVKEVEVGLSDEERETLDAFRAVNQVRADEEEEELFALVRVRDQALADFDRLAAQAAERLSYRLWGDAVPLIAGARERLLLGFDLFPDGPLFKMGAEQLSKEADEELEDAINYVVSLLVREEARKTLSDESLGSTPNTSGERGTLASLPRPCEPACGTAVQGGSELVADAPQSQT